MGVAVTSVLELPGWGDAVIWIWVQFLFSLWCLSLSCSFKITLFSCLEHKPLSSSASSPTSLRQVKEN